MYPSFGSILKEIEKKYMDTAKNIYIVDSNTNARRSNKIARRVSKILKMEKFKAPPK